GEPPAGPAPRRPAVATAFSAALGGLATAGADGAATLESTTQAYVSGSSLTAAGHKVYVHGSSNLTATVTSDGTAVASVIGVAVSLGQATISGATRAFVSGGTTTTPPPALPSN